MSGFHCEFTEEPPKWLQYKCPVCLLVLREPYQVTCCGKSFCGGCIQQIKAQNKPCPTCNQKFVSFPNKGLQQPLYGFQVLCSNKGCDWQGELGQLDQHLNSNPDKDIQLVGCPYTAVKCLYCYKLYPRGEIHQHQTSLCVQRPYTCPMCMEYKSTYENVKTNHAPECEWRPVECPNSCGAANVQHKILEEHVSKQCPLSHVECKFSDAGCTAKMCRKDLPSHLSDSMDHHMELLTYENTKLKRHVRDLKDENGTLKLQLQEQDECFRENGRLKLQLELVFSRVPPVDMEFCFFDGGESPISDPIYSHVGGYKLKLQVTMKREYCPYFTPSVRYIFLESEFERLPPWKLLHITLQRVFRDNDIQSWDHTICSKNSRDRTFTLTGRGGSEFDKVAGFRVARIKVEN